MIRRRIINKITGEKLEIFEDGEFEYVNPVKHFKDAQLVQFMALNGIPDEELYGGQKPSKRSLEIYKIGLQLWDSIEQRFRAAKLPENLRSLLSTTKKKEQISLLKNLVFTPDILMAFLIEAHEKYGYTVSRYSSHYQQKGLDTTKLPFAYAVNENGEAEVFGETELSDGQLQQALQHRKVKNGYILDKGEIWHCFFTTFKSLRGEETWLGEQQPHYHYLSNAFGHKRDSVVNELRSEHYNLGNLPHIKLEDYGKQPNQ